MANDPLPGNQSTWPPSAKARTSALGTVTEYSLPPSPPSIREFPKVESPVASTPTFTARSLVSRLYKPPKVQSAAPPLPKYLAPIASFGRLTSTEAAPHEQLSTASRGN